MYDAIEHNCNSDDEFKTVNKFLDHEIGTEYETDLENLTIVVFDLTPKELQQFNDFLKKQGYLPSGRRFHA